MAKNLIVILGPTASGKTALAAKLAYDLTGEIISADSRQVYKGMDIGTGKDLNQYNIDGKQIAHHLIDVIEPESEFSLFEFQNRFYEIFIRLIRKKILPIMVGGTGLYLESVLAGYNMPQALPDEGLRENLAKKSKGQLQEMLMALKPRLHNKTDLDDNQRLIRAIEIEMARQVKENEQQAKPDIDAVIFGIRWERSLLRRRIELRLKQRLEQGMIEEVKELHADGLSWERLDSFGLEYRYISRYLQNKMTLDDMTVKLTTGIRQFAKRQETWFRRMEKKGIAINWIEGNDYPLLKESVEKYLK
jgi:tRNA dimethylallyltransferase